MIIPEGVNEIDMGTFWHCSRLTSVNIPKSMRAIGGMAFEDCDSLSVICYSGTEEEWQRITVGSCNKPLFKAQIVFDFHPE